MAEKINAYYLLERIKETKIPRFDCIRTAGVYKPMESQISKRGEMAFYLNSKTEGNSNRTDKAPEKYLQGRNSINLSGLYGYYTERGLSGFAVGNPPEYMTKQGKRVETAFKGSNVIFLFVFSEICDYTPKRIELIVISNTGENKAKTLDKLICGGFDPLIKELRDKSTNFVSIQAPKNEGGKK